jgi:signal transduction histidine kinase
MTGPPLRPVRLMRRGWLRLPRRTVRLRLTLVYGGLFLLCGTALLGITYLLVSQHLPKAPVPGGASTGSPPLGSPSLRSPVLPGTASGAEVYVRAPTGVCSLLAGPFGTPAQVAAHAQKCLNQQRAVELKQLLTESGMALAITTVVSVGLGWLVAGRVLRKLRTITATARSISASNLHARLALAGPDDELRELGDTFDALLTRLEAAFEAQRRFVANASHELRTPLARQRTLVEVALADPEPSVATLRDICTRVLAAGEQQERLIEALLTLARSQRGLDRREAVDLAEITGQVLLARRPEAELRAISVTASLGPALALGDARLAERLVANLVDNALRHNAPRGTIEISTATCTDRAVVSVSNTGPMIPADDVARLFLPFQRSGADRTSVRDGLGLGLSIVAAIAEAHGARLQAHALPGGGLAVQAGFPREATWSGISPVSGSRRHPAPEPNGRR